MRHSCVLAAFFVCSFSIFAQAQDQTQGQPAAIVRANTRLVMLDVLVLDKSGKAVKGLTADDFRVLEKGKPQTVSVFQGPGDHFHKNTTPLPPGVYSNRPWTQQTDQPAVILVIDVLNTPFNMVPLMKKDILTYLSERRTHPNTAIFALGRSLRLLQDFSTDTRLLQAAIKQYYESANESRTERPGAEALAPLIAGDPGLVAMLPQVIENVKQMDLEVGGAKEAERVQITTEAFRAIAAATAGIPQRKHLLWLSGSFPLIFGVDAPDQFNFNRNFADYLRDSATKLADARISVFPVDAKRLLGADYVDASSNGRTMMGGTNTDPGTVPKGTDFANEIGAADARNFSQYSSMEEIAQFTGGKVFTNRNDLDKALLEGGEGFPDYYTVGYYPENKKWDGKFRKIEVKLNGKDYDLRYRKGYFATQPPESGLDQFRKDKDAQLRQAIRQPMNASELTFIARLNEAANPPQFDFLVDPDHLRLTPEANGDKQLLDMDFAAVAFLPDGKIAKYNVVPAHVLLTPEVVKTVQTKGVIFHVPLEVAPGTYRVRLVIRDNQTGMIGSLDMPTGVSTKPGRGPK